MTTSLAYDHPNHTIIREYPAGRAGGAAATKYCPFRMKQAGTLVAVHLVCAVSGSGTNPGIWQVLVNGGSLGAVTTMTNVVNSTLSFTFNRTVTSLTDVFEVLSGAEAAAKVDVIYEYKVAFPSDAT